ncbi:MAG: Cyanophycin synthetase [candidate division WS6 bacterium 36_33]|uniref:Cyanophycin synthetase n=1 Tax=candidate division WS6 bacterium 36_33 TaxID=1641388 RepID=A0A101GZN9_9BACT|nr:MAG: Cyanophycin synthetase [candidate division WS6 bacterium 36_33]
MKTYEQYLKEAGNVHLAYYLEAADHLGIEYKILAKGLLADFKYEDKHWHIINTVIPLIPATSTTICKRKHLTNIVLAERGLPVPKQTVILSPIDAIKFYGEYKDIVIKPTQQLGGAGITILPQNEEQVLKAYEKALKETQSKSKNKVIAEEFIHGENYRFLVLDNEVIGVVRRKAAHVVGNSKNTIRELISMKNKERGDSLLKPIQIDNEVTLKLQREGLNLESVPEEGKEVILRYNCNLTTGGTTQECIKEVHDYYKQIAVKAVKTVGSKFGGVDIITKNISKPTKLVINEINYNPGLRLHYKVNKGDVVKVAIPIMKYLRDKEY